MERLSIPFPPLPAPAPAPCTDALCFLSRHVWQAPFINRAKLGLQTIPALDCIFFLYEQKVSVNYLKSIYNILFEPFGVSGLSMN